MVVQPIPRSLFEQFGGRFTLPASLEEDYEWFAERSRILIGYIARNRHSREWTFTVEGRDERGEFHAVDSLDHIATVEKARALLEASIAKLCATGLKVFPRHRNTSEFA